MRCNFPYVEYGITHEGLHIISHIDRVFWAYEQSWFYHSVSKLFLWLWFHLFMGLQCVPVSNTLVILSTLAYTQASAAQWGKLSHVITVQPAIASLLCVSLSLPCSPHFTPPPRFSASKKASLSLLRKYRNAAQWNKITHHPFPRLYPRTWGLFPEELVKTKVVFQSC